MFRRILAETPGSGLPGTEGAMRHVPCGAEHAAVGGRLGSGAGGQAPTANRLHGGARVLAENEPEQGLFLETPKLRVSVLPIRQGKLYTGMGTGPAVPPAPGNVSSACRQVPEGPHSGHRLLFWPRCVFGSLVWLVLLEIRNARWVISYSQSDLHVRNSPCVPWALRPWHQAA